VRSPSREGLGAPEPETPFTTNAGDGTNGCRSAGPRRRTYLDLAIKPTLSNGLVNVSTLVLPAYGCRALDPEVR